MWGRTGKETVNTSVFLSTLQKISSAKELEAGDDCCPGVRGGGTISCRL